MHFFNPVRRMTLVEVVRGPATSDATVGHRGGPREAARRSAPWSSATVPDFS